MDTRSSLAFQAQILSRINEAVVAIDAAGAVTYLNAAAERQYGISAAEALGRPLSDVYLYEWTDPADEARARTALAETGSWRGENRHILRTGEVLHVDSSVSVLQDPDGGPGGLLAVLRDITDAKRVQEELVRREERFRRALSSETVGVLFFRLDGGITDANASFERMSGYSRDELRDIRHWEQLTERQFLEATAQAAAELVARGETAPYEKRMIRKDGSRWWGLFAPRRLEGLGRSAECVEFIIDITEQKRAEAALRESDERQRMALDAADLGTWKHDIARGRVHLDARARSHYALDRETVAVEDVLDRIHPEDQPALQQAIAAAVDPLTRAAVDAEYRVADPAGGVRWLSVNGHVHFEATPEGERPSVGIGTTRDITEQKRAEEELREADRRKDEFLAILAHELRNPLAPIRTAVGILRAPGVPEPLLARSRDIIERQVAHMTRLIDDLLDVSRLSRGKMTLQRGPLLLDGLIDAAIETARPTIEQHGHRLERHRAGTAVCVDGDAARLSQVFANLLNNAAKYTPDGGGIRIAVAEGDATVDIRVTDTGQGIAPDRLETIFDLFAQGSGAPARALGGLGIGLALARRLTELHGGTLRASSRGLGHGATFTVVLPKIAGVSCSGAERPKDGTRRVARRVLVVDDSVDAADTTATLLEAAGCVVRATYDGESAVAEIPRFRPEIVLLDLGMPGMDGLETCRRLRTLEHGRSAFVVAVTGWGQEDDRRRTRAAGFDAHLVKPVAPDALLEAVEGAPRAGSGT